MRIEDVKISVVIPTCDRQSLLLDSLESVVNQSFRPYEIVIVDNGYKPSSIDTESYPVTVRYFRALPRFGVSQARNLGAIMAKGDYLAFLDDDDLWKEDYLEQVAGTIRKKNAEIILTSLTDFDSGKLIESKSQPIENNEQFIDELLKRNPGAVGSNTIIKKETFFSFSGYDPYLTTGQDKAAILDLIVNNPEINIVRSNKAFVRFRQDFSIERQTEVQKLLKGKKRFLSKYWKLMSLSVRFRVFSQLVILYLKNIKKKIHE